MNANSHLISEIRLAFGQKPRKLNYPIFSRADDPELELAVRKATEIRGGKNSWEKLDISLLHAVGDDFTVMNDPAAMFLLPALLLAALECECCLQVLQFVIRGQKRRQDRGSPNFLAELTPQQVAVINKVLEVNGDDVVHESHDGW